jgi:uncharacterized membrane protein
MKTPIIAYLIFLFLILLVDAVWLTFIIKNFVTESIGHLMDSSVKMGPVLVFYPLYAFAVIVLIVLPAIDGNFSLLKVFFLGALFGLAAYGAYDLTNHATLKNWPITMTVIDMTWGSLMTGGISLFTFYLTNLFIK